VPFPSASGAKFNEFVFESGTDSNLASLPSHEAVLIHDGPLDIEGYERRPQIVGI
jgi:hypothetical protein